MFFFSFSPSMETCYLLREFVHEIPQFLFNCWLVSIQTEWIFCNLKDNTRFVFLVSPTWRRSRSRYLPVQLSLIPWTWTSVQCKLPPSAFQGVTDLRDNERFVSVFCRPIGIPEVKRVTLHNPSRDTSIQMLSISSSTRHFHCSFFRDKVSRWNFPRWGQ